MTCGLGDRDDEIGLDKLGSGLKVFCSLFACTNLIQPSDCLCSICASSWTLNPEKDEKKRARGAFFHPAFTQVLRHEYVVSLAIINFFFCPRSLALNHLPYLSRLNLQNQLTYDWLADVSSWESPVESRTQPLDSKWSSLAVILKVFMFSNACPN